MATIIQELGKRQNAPRTPEEQFYALAAQITKSENRACLQLNFATKP
jgi:hypothetical protein